MCVSLSLAAPQYPLSLSLCVFNQRRSCADCRWPEGTTSGIARQVNFPHPVPTPTTPPGEPVTGVGLLALTD